MRKRKTVFIDGLLAMFFCWGVSTYFNPSDIESVQLLAGLLLLICTLILIPVALYNLKTSSSFKGGFYLFLMMLPLLGALSHPAFSLMNFHLILTKISFLSDIKPWFINFMVNLIIFFLAGYIFVGMSKGQQSCWKETALTSILLTSFYILSFYYLYILPPSILGSV